MLNKNTLKNFLDKKTLYYDKIDYETIKQSWSILSKKIQIPFVVHIVGTNGKGSTGRLLSHYLYKKNYGVLHYSSPHIINFNERIWINGSDAKNDDLQKAHLFLQDLLTIELLDKLTYFEYTTLLAIYLSNNMDYLVLEAGLGGEFDATNVVKNDISLITTIGLDHQNFLGNTVVQISSTKLRSVDKKMILGYQIFDEVSQVANDIKDERHIELLELKTFDKYCLDKKFPSFLNLNLHLAIACLEELNISIDLELFNDVKLFGRCQKILSNVTIDVGHNPLAASMLVKEFQNKKINLIYNSYKDKDYKGVLEILKPIIKNISIINLNDSRIVEKNILLQTIEELKININTNSIILDHNEEYLVFGSFLVVEEFLNLIKYNANN